MGRVFINDAHLVPPLREDVGAEKFAHIAERLRPLLKIKAHLFGRPGGGRRLFRFGGSGRSGFQLCRFGLRGRIPCCHVVPRSRQVICVRLNVELGLAGCCSETRRNRFGKVCLRFRPLRAVQADVRIQGSRDCNRCPAVFAWECRERPRQDVRFCCCRADGPGGHSRSRGRRCSGCHGRGSFGVLFQCARLRLPRNDGRKPCKAICLYSIFTRIFVFFRTVGFFVVLLVFGFLESEQPLAGARLSQRQLGGVVHKVENIILAGEADFRFGRVHVDIHQV